MALVTGPLGSFAASGKIGGMLVFGTNKGRNVVRRLVTPSNPKTGAQKGQRAMMSFLAPAWAPLSAANKATWVDLSAENNVSEFNAFTRFNLNRWSQWLDPMQTPVIAAGTIPVMGALTATGGVRQISVSQVITTVNDIWGMIIALSLTTGFTPAKSDTVVGVRYTVSPIAFVITGLAPGNYFLRTAGFTTGGARTAFVAQAAPVVT